MLLKKAYELLSPVERRQAWLVLAFAILVAIFEMIGTLSVVPFLAVLANPEIIQENRFLSWIYSRLGYTDTEGFLILLGGASFTLLLFSAGVRAVGQYVVFRFSQLRGYSISRRLMEVYLRRPYAYYLSRNTGDMSRKILSETQILTSEVYQPLTQLAAQLLIVFSLVGLLVAVDPRVALTALVVLGGFYALIYFLAQSLLRQLGTMRIAANKQRFRIASETFGGIKTLKLLGRERSKLDHFDRVARRMAHLQAKIQTLGEVPRYGIEAIAFGGIILLALILLMQYRNEPGGALGRLLPLLGLYAFAGYRLMPAMQKVYFSLAKISTGATLLDTVGADLAGIDKLPEISKTPAIPLSFKHEIILQRIGFCHDGAEAPSLHDINLSLAKGKSLGIVGTTGAGKTTLMDVFLGILTPDNGEIIVDGIALTPANMRSWQAGIGYVPQDIFLVDGSIAENIAFSFENREIDHERVANCARMAQLEEFVTSQLPEGYNTMVGERGVRLSGGQRQRIGIARALYHDPEVLVFDEATSALDAVTEKAVVDTIATLSGTKTMMIVAHRISTIRGCDQILVLDHGQMVGYGSYDELCSQNPIFQKLVDATKAA